MAGEYAKDRTNDFAYWANLGAKNDLTDEEAEGLMGLLGDWRNQDAMDEEDALEAALIQSENLYRVACLLAYGSGCAGVCDVERFTKVEAAFADNAQVLKTADGYDESELQKITVALPYTSLLDKARIPKRLFTPPEYRSVLNPNKPSFFSVRYKAYKKGYQTFEAQFFPDIFTSKNNCAQVSPMACKYIGQLIASAYTFTNYIGMYDGKPLFEAQCGFDRLWQTVAELASQQAPGICPVCGKVIDRRRDEKGGHPKKTCAAHSDKFQNMKKKQREEELIRKRLLKKDNPDMSTCVGSSENFEPAVRRMRWREIGLNERPLKFLKIASFAK